jgi:hypothetical protein
VSQRPSEKRPGGSGGGPRHVFSSLSSRGRLASVASVSVVVVLGAAVAGAAMFSSAPNSKQHHGSTTSSVTPHVVSSSTIPPPKLDRHLCPLTGVRPPDGKVPQRPAIGIKIGNDPAARPQSGLPDADIVYEEMAEGGITRYLAVFQCRQAPSLGPVRSVRWDDWHVLASYNHPLLAYSGGIDQWEQVAAGLKWLYNADASFFPMANAYYRLSSRYAPENLYTSTAALWKLDPANHEPPPAQFQYRRSPAAAARPAASVTLAGLSESENVTWTWSSRLGAWMRSQGGSPDNDASGQQLRAADVVIQMVRTEKEPYYESGDVFGVESITDGSGIAYLLRNGKIEKGTWKTPRYGDTMELRLPNGDLMALAPGNTWVEMVPTSFPVQIQK